MAKEQTSLHLQHIPTAIDRLTIAAHFPQRAPDVLFEYWTKPDLICQWWPPQAVIEPYEGGAYHFAWPRMGWDLRGQYVTFDIGRTLGFTWKWDHEAAPPRHVEITFDALPGGGTQITLTHGVYTDSTEDQQERKGHLEGWTHFLGQLQQLSAK